MPIEIRELVVRGAIGPHGEVAPVMREEVSADCDSTGRDLPEHLADKMLTRLLERIREQEER